MLYGVLFVFFLFFFFKQKTAYEMRISDWSSDVCSSDLRGWIEPIFSTLLWARTMLKWALPASNAALAALPAANWRRVICFMVVSSLWSFSGSYLAAARITLAAARRSEENTSELQSLMRISYAVFCLKKNTTTDIYMLTSN